MIFFGGIKCLVKRNVKVICASRPAYKTRLTQSWHPPPLYPYPKYQNCQNLKYVTMMVLQDQLGEELKMAKYQTNGGSRVNASAKSANFHLNHNFIYNYNYSPAPKYQAI